MWYTVYMSVHTDVLIHNETYRRDLFKVYMAFNRGTLNSTSDGFFLVYTSIYKPSKK